MESRRVKACLWRRLIVSLGDRDVSRRPTPAINALAMRLAVWVMVAQGWTRGDSLAAIWTNKTCRVSNRRLTKEERIIHATSCGQYPNVTETDEREIQVSAREWQRGNWRGALVKVCIWRAPERTLPGSDGSSAWSGWLLTVILRSKKIQSHFLVSQLHRYFLTISPFRPRINPTWGHIYLKMSADHGKAWPLADAELTNSVCTCTTFARTQINPILRRS